MIWMGLMLFVLALNAWVPSYFWERWYYRGFFIGFRQTFDFLLGWSPIPMIYILITVILARTAGWILRWEKGFTCQASRAIGGLSALIVLFYTLWGFNYRQIPLQEKMGFDLDRVNTEEIKLEFERATLELKTIGEGLSDRLTSDEAIADLTICDADVRSDVENALAELGLPHTGRVRVRQLWPKGFLLRWNTAGIYIPQSGEGHIDKGLLSVQKPFTIAHEMAHGYGVTDEGACNFIAWLACRQSRDQWVRFGGAFTYWRYVAAEMPSDSVTMVLNRFPAVILRSLEMIRENDRKYPDLMPKVRDAVYASYLKRHGVKGGLRSYNYVVLMVQEYLASRSSGDRSE